MNIFACYNCPQRSAEVLDDQRVVKLIMECVQMLSAVASHYGQWEPGYMKVTHASHPCTIWTATGRENFDWLWDHAWSLDQERRARFDSVNVHKSLEEAHRAGIQKVRKAIPIGRTPHYNGARHKGLGIDYTAEPDVHLAYRKYLRARWRAQQEHYPHSRLASSTIKGFVNGTYSRSGLRLDFAL